MTQGNHKPLFVFEMANNHMGDVAHGLHIIRQLAEVSAPFSGQFQFAFKLQYRHLDTLIHPDFRGSTEFKYLKRFTETRLQPTQFETLKDEMAKNGFLTMSTPFDERSVDLIEEQGLDIIKIASCSFTDWPLLERISLTKKPVIGSAAGICLREIDNVVSFFDHRRQNFSLMHCVADYPTSDANLQLNQIDLFRQRYPQIRIGYSTHERPDNLDPVKMAVAKGAVIFEKHVGVKTAAYALNNYSATPAQVRDWLGAAAQAFVICGIRNERSPFTETELSNLRSLRRGLFAKQHIARGERIAPSAVFLAMPTLERQYTANDFSKYAEFIVTSDIEANQPLMESNTCRLDHRDRVYAILNSAKEILKKSHASVPRKVDFELSHHYGIERFEEFGAVIVNFVNREYCKKLIVLHPGQQHPEQFHKLKEETFQLLYGDLELILDGIRRVCEPGEIITIQRGVRHSFRSNGGAVIEEISSKHYVEDSYYLDPSIAANTRRKTLITYWID